MRHLFRLINFKTCFLMQLFHDWLTSLPPLPGPPLPWLGGCLVTRVAGLADTCSPTLLARGRGAMLHVVTGLWHFLWAANWIVTAEVTLAQPGSSSFPKTCRWQYCGHIHNPRRQHVKSHCSSNRQSCLCFELLEVSSPWVSHVSAHLANEAGAAVCSRPPFQGCLFSEWPWGTEMGSPCGGRARVRTLQHNQGNKGQAGWPPSMTDSDS